jgi:hypothetical protein
MTTREELNQSFDRLSQTVLRVKAERDALLAVAKRVYAELDDRYDVDQEGEHSREIPFNGAGELMGLLRNVVEKCERA